MDFKVMLINLAISLLGVATIVYAKFITSATGESFNFKLFWKDNKIAVIGSLVGLPLILTVLTVVPEAADNLKMLLGIDVNMTEVTNGAAFTLGAAIYSTIRNASKTKGA